MSNTGTAATNGIASDKEVAVFKKINRRLLPFLLICYTFAYLDRVNIGYAKLHMQAEIPGLTEACLRNRRRPVLPRLCQPRDPKQSSHE